MVGYEDGRTLMQDLLGISVKTKTLQRVQNNRIKNKIYSAPSRSFWRVLRGS